MKRIVVVGVGALGSHTVQFLRNVGAQIRVVDFDRVERKNTASQFHAKQSVGKSKVLGLQRTVDFLWGLKLDVVPHKLVADNAEQVLGNADLLIDCLDNGEARRVIQGYARENKVPCLHGALDANGSFGAVMWDAKFRIDDEPDGGAATCEDGEHLPFIAVTASFLARAAQEFLATSREISYHVRPDGVVRT